VTVLKLVFDIFLHRTFRRRDAEEAGESPVDDPSND
jgi:hypothetical protein